MLSTRAATILRAQRTALHSRLGSQSYRYRHPPTPPPPNAQSQPSGSGTASAVGLASGALGAMCGVGGAVFVIPGLVRFASLPQRVAAGNALVAVTCIASTGAYSFFRAGCIDVPIAASLGVTAALLTPVGAIVGRRVDSGVLRRALGGFMILLSPLMPLRGYLEKRDGAVVNASSEKKAILAVAGAGVGFGSGMLGISGGSLFTPLIAIMYPDVSFKTVLGTSFAAMIVPTAIGAMSYARMGLVTPALVPPLVLGSVVGAGVGSGVALAVPEEVLQWVFAAVFAALGGRILRAPLRKPGKVEIERRVAAPA